MSYEIKMDYRGRKTLTVAFLGILKLGVFRPRLTRLDGPLVQVLLQTHKAIV